jgi:hypothetical protein
LIVLTRAEGGYDNDIDVSAAQMESERKEGQAKLAQLSTNGKQIILHCGHNMELEAPDGVVSAIRHVVEAVRNAERCKGCGGGFRMTMPSARAGISTKLLRSLRFR